MKKSSRSKIILIIIRPSRIANVGKLAIETKQFITSAKLAQKEDKT